MAMRENHTNRFFTNMKFLWKYIFDTILYKVSMVCTKIRMQVYQNGKNISIKHSVARLF